jgi:hypothetical protein
VWARLGVNQPQHAVTRIGSRLTPFGVRRGGQSRDLPSPDVDGGGAADSERPARRGRVAPFVARGVPGDAVVVLTIGRGRYTRDSGSKLPPLLGDCGVARRMMTGRFGCGPSSDCNREPAEDAVARIGELGELP